VQDYVVGKTSDKYPNGSLKYPKPSP
jgi:hypothetical protein